MQKFHITGNGFIWAKKAGQESLLLALPNKASTCLCLCCVETLPSGKARRSSVFGRMPLITKWRDYAVERKEAWSFLGFKECKEPLIGYENESFQHYWLALNKDVRFVIQFPEHGPHRRETISFFSENWRRHGTSGVLGRERFPLLIQRLFSPKHGATNRQDRPTLAVNQQKWQ